MKSGRDSANGFVCAATSQSDFVRHAAPHVEHQKCGAIRAEDFVRPLLEISSPWMMCPAQLHHPLHVHGLVPKHSPGVESEPTSVAVRVCQLFAPTNGSVEVLLLWARGGDNDRNTPTYESHRHRKRIFSRRPPEKTEPYHLLLALVSQGFSLLDSDKAPK